MGCKEEQPSSCSNCSPHRFAMDRLDVWKAADHALKDTEWNEDIEITPQDVLMLALFLGGDTIDNE